MKGFTTILRKEYAEFFRTWRVWVVGGAFVLFRDGVVGRYRGGRRCGTSGRRASLP